jgi:biotin carboxyl carrier protein
MARQVNKKYEEFWNNKEFEVKTGDTDTEDNKKTKKKTVTPRKKTETVTEEQTVQPIVESQPIVTRRKPEAESVTKTLKEIYEQYDTDGKPYRIYLRGNVIFDSASHKIRPQFFEEYFILFGNKYIYKGIRFEKY